MDLENTSFAEVPVDFIPESATDIVLTPDEPIIVAQYFRLDEKGQKRKYARTRNGREMRYFTNEEFAAWCELHPYDPEL